MKNKDCGKLIKASNNPPKKREGSGRRFEDKTGEVRMMSCGQTATIIAYRDSKDIDVQFEDGNIVTNRSYVSFTQGYIKHPNHEISGLNKYQKGFIKERIGESKIMNNGLRATIIDYKGRYDVDIEFEDGVIIRGICYSSWVKGESSHPTVKTPRKRLTPNEELVGLTHIMSNGMKATIIAAKGKKEVDVQFEDGAIVKRRAYSAFKSGNICHPDRKENRVGETRMMNNGMECTITAYRTSRDIDVTFSDGTIITNKDYTSFLKGNIRNPNIVNKKENRAKTKLTIDAPTVEEAMPIVQEPLPESIDELSCDTIEYSQDSHLYDTKQIDKSKKILLFECSLSSNGGPTYYYYIEKDDKWHYFKFGVSRTGAVIKPYEDTRLNIMAKTEDDYNEFKYELYGQFCQFYDFYNSFNMHGYYRFFDETEKQWEFDTFKWRIPLSEFMQDHFHKSLEQFQENKDQYKLLDKFQINSVDHVILHDNRYPEEPVDLMVPEDKDGREEIIGSFFTCYAKNADTYKSFQAIKMHNHVDLMSEMLYIDDLKRYPNNLITVDGWCVKDFHDGTNMELLEAYSWLRELRVDPEIAREKLIERLHPLYPQMFKKEIEQQNQITQEAEDREHEDDAQFPPLNFNTTSKVDILAKIYEEAHKKFLSTYTIPMLCDELKQYILGQDELVLRVATFIYYHILRQVHGELSPRPLLISGPSGSGKTEVWRVAKKLLSSYVNIEIIDGSTITQEGWSGQRKLVSYLQELDTASILVIDEFDKLSKPSYSRGGENVSQSIQSEFLKLLEGDYQTDDIRLSDGSRAILYDCSTLGIVMVGAFEHIRDEKEHENDGVVGFIKRNNAPTYERCVTITDEDLIEFGVLPELVGRISDKCTTNKLTAEQYLEIIKNQHSKVNTLMKELNVLGIDTNDVLNDDSIMDLAEKSQVNMLGVRWVSSQIENQLMNLLVQSDLRNRFNEKQTTETSESPIENELF